MDRNFEPNPTIARADSDTVAFTDYALTLGPAGNLVLIWEEQSPDGVDMHYVVHDPASGKWSRDERLFADAALERSFAPAWDNAGNLTVGYNRVQIQTGPKTVTTDDGQTITVDNVPQPGRVDLAIVKRSLVKDLGLMQGDFAASGGNFLPGETVALSLTVRNLGDLPVESVNVAFYDGDPLNGGTEILPRQTLSELNGASTATVSSNWIVPAPAGPHALYAVIDPDGSISEINETNNKLSLTIGGTDLSATLASKTVEADGSARVIIEVVNNGSPATAPSTLAIRYADDGAGVALATAPISNLGSGELAQIPLDLLAGSVSGERLFRITADDGLALTEPDRENNSVTFAMVAPATATSTSTSTETPTATPTPTPSFTLTPTVTRTHTATPSPTLPRTPTATSTATPSLTHTPTATNTNTATPSPTLTHTATVTRTVTLTPTPTPTPGMLVCDVAPIVGDQNGDGDTLDAGEFGNGTVNNADVVAIFRASLLTAPPSETDLFSAMDAITEDSPPMCGGDGHVRNNDVVACFRRSLLPSAPRYQRSATESGCVASRVNP